MRLAGARLITVITVLMLIQPFAAGVQPAEKVRRVGILGVKASDPAEAGYYQAFRLGLRERGWTEGENISLEFRWTEGNSARLPRLVADLIRLKVDVILARSSIFVQPAKEATSAIPIVFVTHADPVASGHVASLARPGGNITGLSESAQDIEAKRLELLKAVNPRIKRVAVLWDPDTPSHPPRLNVVEEAGRTLRLQLQVLGVRTGAELEGAFSSMAREHAQAVLVLSSAFALAERQRLTELAMRHRLPTMFGQREPVEAGGLMSYGPDFADLYRRGAIFVDKILRGARPADLPVEQPTKFILILNRKTAKALGLTMPPALLLQADRIID
jgi:putative tryptophan/tyrosine transport system substrate-binding protein